MMVFRSVLAGLMAAALVSGWGTTLRAQDADADAWVEPPLTAEEAAAVPPLLSVVNDLCIPVVLGAKLEDTPGYAALGRPPVDVSQYEDEPAITSLSTAVVEDLEIGGGVCSFRGQAHAPGLEAAVVASKPNLVRMPELQGVDSLYFDTETGLTLRWDRYGLHIEKADGDLDTARAYYASMIAAESRNRIDALMGAIAACPAYLRVETDWKIADAQQLDIGTDGTAYGAFPNVRGDIEARLQPSNIGCVITFEAEPAFVTEIAAALARPGTGWNADGIGAWRRVTAEDPELGTGESLLVDICDNRYALVYMPGQEMDYRAGSFDWIWRPCASEALPVPEGPMYRRAGA